MHKACEGRMLLSQKGRKKTGLTVTKYQSSKQPNLLFSGLWFNLEGLFTLPDNTRAGLTALRQKFAA